MAEDNITLRKIFFEDAAEGAAGSPLTASEGLAELREGFRKQLPKVAWELIQQELQAKFEQVLGVRVSEILGAAWGKYKGLQEYADPEKHPPGETALVPLAEHKISSAHSPHIDILIKEIEVGSLNLDVQLELNLKSVVLKVENGRIRSAQAGSFQGEGSLECSFRRGELAKELLSFKRQTPLISLERSLSFGDGIEIPGPRPRAGGSPAT